MLCLADFEVGDPGDFSIPCSKGNFKDNIRAGRDNIKSVAYRACKEYNPSFDARFASFPNATCGIDAVYRLFSFVYCGDLVFKTAMERAEADSFIHSTAKVMGPSSYSTPASWNQFFKGQLASLNTVTETDPFRFFQQAEGIRHLVVCQNTASHRRAVRRAKVNDGPLPKVDPKLIFESPHKRWECYRHRAVTVIYDVPCKLAYVLLGKDITRLAQMIDSAGKTYLYMHNYADKEDGIGLNRKMVGATRQTFNMLLEAFRRNKKNEQNSICRSMDICQYIYLADLAGPLAERSKTAQRMKGHDGYYNKVFPLDRFVTLLRELRPREALEIASIRKILPVPDFCTFSCQESSRAMHYSPHTLKPHPDPLVTFDDFSLYWSWSMLRNFYERHKRLPGRVKDDALPKEWHVGYPDCKPSDVPYKEVEDIDWEGTFAYTDYEYAQHELVKDKVCAPRRVDPKLNVEELNALPVQDRNQVAHFLLDRNAEGPEVLRSKILAGKDDWDNVSLVANKPETKKEGGRNFYMQGACGRILLSEFEANVSEYLVHKPGNSSGISDAALAKRMHEIAAPSETRARSVKISFDLEKWSPKQNPILKEVMYDKWAYAFGMPHLRKLRKFQNGARLVYIKHNIHHEYLNPGQDLEGYDAKKNTAMHIDIMSYAISVCRRKGLVNVGAKLLALIDDGGASLEFDPGTTDDQILDCIDCIEQVYEMVGLRISWDKTFVSELLFQYLNEVYYRGFKVTPGLKAFLRVGKPVDVPARTIIDDIDAAAGTVQGAIKAGTPYMTAYLAYLVETYKAIKAWSHYKVKLGATHSLMCILPIALGGLGLKSLPQLVTNEAFNPLVAALGNLKSFVHTYPSNRALVNTLLSTSMRQMSSEALVRAPRAIRAEVPTLNLQRFQIAMSAWILEHARNPYITSVLQSAKFDTSSALAARVSSMVEVTSVGLNALARLRPEEAVKKLVGKLQRSDTAVKLLGPRESMKLVVSNRRQAEHMIVGFGRVFNRAALVC